MNNDYSIIENIVFYYYEYYYTKIPFSISFADKRQWAAILILSALLLIVIILFIIL